MSEMIMMMGTPLDKKIFLLELSHQTFLVAGIDFNLAALVVFAGIR